jgi:hypothetical protein
MPDHICQAGQTEYGSPYWVTVNKKTGAQVEYQDYQCRHTDCSQVIPIRTGKTR